MSSAGPPKNLKKKPRRPAGKISGPAYVEAEARVAKASAEGAVELDLEITGLTRLPPLVGLTGLQSLNLTNTRVSDLTPLANLIGLQSLDLSNTQVSDFALFAGLTALQSLNLFGTKISDLAPLVGLTALQSLDLECAEVFDITPLSSLTALRSLDLTLTQVTDLAPLAGLVALQRLRVAHTPLSDLAPLAGLPELQLLDLYETQVSDLTPLAGLTSLIDGSRIGRGLNFHNCPLMDGVLVGFSKLKNPDRTIKAINYVREQQGLAPYYPEAKADDVQALPISELEKRLQQDNGATRVVRQGDQMALAPSGAEIDAAVADQPMARQLHDRLRPKAKALADFAVRVGNLPGWRDFAEDTKAMQQLVELPLSDIAERVAEFWCLSGSLGAFLEQDEKAEHPSSMTLQLEADGRRLLSQVVEISAVLTRQFPTAEKLDSDLREALHKPERVEPAKATIEIAGETHLLRADHVILLHAALVGPESGGPQSQKAHDRSVRTTRNVVFGALVAGGILIPGGIAEGYLKEIGSEIARHDILARRIEDFVVKGEKDIADLLDGEPADKKAAVKEMIRRIKNKDAAPPGRQGKDGK